MTGGNLEILTIPRLLAIREPAFTVHYGEGLKVGYKWYDAEHREVLFPFGFGLSYTTICVLGSAGEGG